MPVSTNGSTPGAAGPEGGEQDPSRNLLGEKVQGPRTRLKYKHDHEHYSGVIGVSVRTIKRWVALGKKKSDLCPLDDLAAILDWWTRCQTYSPPVEIIQASAEAQRAKTTGAGEEVVSKIASNTTEGKGGKAAAKPEAGEREKENGGKPLIDTGAMSVISLEESLQRISRQHRANLDLLDKAYGGTSEAEITNRTRNARISGEMLKDAQKALDEYRRSRGDVVPIAEVKAEGFRVHTAMAVSLLEIVINMGVPRARAAAGLNAWYLQLRESRFFADTMPAIPSTAAPAP